MRRSKTQRLRDPIYNLIVFREDDELDGVDQVAWKLIDCREFQRLRRIRQLGFSEFVYPGATHTRFSHCIGVFHTARRLLAIMKRKLGAGFEPEKAEVAVIAALLHDLGHGPFSHTFEGVERRRRAAKSHEKWTAEIIRGDTQVHRALENRRTGLADQVASLLAQSEPSDIYSAVVSSQFDADRLDYLRRDRYMTGTASGGIDFEWLLDCLEVGEITVGVADERDFVTVPGLYLNSKGLRAAEEYLLARYNLYAQVYMHKTTRCAEQMLAALLGRVADLIADDSLNKTNLSGTDPLVKYYRDDAGLGGYLALNDFAIWSAVERMTLSEDPIIADLANRLVHRQLYKCFDVGERAKAFGGNALERYRLALKKKASDFDLEMDVTVLIDDRAKISAYGFYNFDEPGALQKVLIGESGTSPPRDISERSPIVDEIPVERLCRIYVPNHDKKDKIAQLWEETEK